MMTLPYVPWGFKEDSEGNGYQEPILNPTPQYEEADREFGSLLTYDFSDQAFKHLIDFYQHQLRYYTEQEKEHQTLWDALVQPDRSDPRQLAYEDLQRLVVMYQGLAGPELSAAGTG